MDSSLATVAGRPDAAVRPCVAEAVTTPATLRALQPAWRALWQQAGASPFLSPAWLLPWWGHIGRGALATVALRCAGRGELVGLAPLYVSTDGSGRRRLFPLGMATTDHADVLVRPGWDAAVAQALREHLMACRGDWEVLEIPQLPAGSPWLAMAWPAGWRREVSEDCAHPVLALPASRPAGLARSLAASRRRAERLGRLDVENAQVHTVLALLDALARLHAQRWAREGLPGVLGEPGVLAAHREAAPHLLADGVLRLFALRIDGRPIAVLYGLADAPQAAVPRWSYYIAGFDPAFAALSPGSLAVAQAIDAAQAEGAVVFDFLRGDEAYKYRWGARNEPRFTLRVTPA